MMSGNMKRLRRTNNPLDRNTRNDINYNWNVLDETLSKIDTSDFKTEQQFNKVDSQIKELEQVDKQLSDRIKKNRDDIDAMNPDFMIEQGSLAAKKGQIAKKQGDKAEEQGNIAEQKGKKAEEQGNLAETKGAKAKQQGDYAKEQGDYANEKAEYAAQTTSEIVEANEDLAKIKLDTIKATQKANTSADYAQQAGDKAEEQVERVQPIINKSEIAYKEVENATNKVNDIVDHVVEQSDYAKETADKINKDYISLKGLKEETIKVKDDANSATVKAIEATDKANTSAENATEQATRAKEKTDYLENLLPNIEGWEFKGEWKHGVLYEKHNIVTHNGSTYILMAEEVNGSPLQNKDWHMLAQRGIDGEGAVQSVNNLAPDLEGNVDLGELATPDDVKDAADKILETSKEYTDEQIKAIPEIDLSPYATTKNTEEQIIKAQTEAKEYTDTKFSEIPEIDISHLETKDDATAKLNEAKRYTDEAIGDVDLSEMEKRINDHSNKKATDKKIGHVTLSDNIDENIGANQGVAATPLAIEKVNNKYQKVLDNTQYGEGIKNKAKGDNTVWGDDHFITDDTVYSTVWGGENSLEKAYDTVPSLYSTVWGTENTVQGGKRNTVWGHKNITQFNASNNTIWGEENSVTNISGTTVWGIQNIAKRTFATVCGMGNIGEGAMGVIVGGVNNKPQDNADDIFMIGNGQGEKKRSNALRLTQSRGNLYISGKYNTTGADYAEMFEWEDGNPNNEDRVGLFVSFADGEKIKLANEGDDILGVVSASAAIVGDSHEDQWSKMYLTDQFGRILTKDVEVEQVDNEGNEYTITETQLVINPEYDHNKEYTPRSQRPEWSPIGLLGKLYVIDDGSCETNGYATISENGIATKGTRENGYRVMKRISLNKDKKQGIVKILLK